MKTLYIIILSVLISSCATQIPGMKRNFKKSDRLAAELFEKNGNSFVVTSSYANFSQVWSYSKTHRVRYDLGKGRIQKVDSTSSNFYKMHFMEAQNTFDGLNLNTCAELDGGLLLIQMKFNSCDKTLNYNAVNIKCLFKEKETTGFIKALADDVDFLHSAYMK